MVLVLAMHLTCVFRLRHMYLLVVILLYFQEELGTFKNVVFSCLGIFNSQGSCMFYRVSRFYRVSIVFQIIVFFRVSCCLPLKFPES